MNNKAIMTLLLTLLISAASVSAANLLDVRLVSTGVGAKTIDGSLADWGPGKLILQRSDFLDMQATSWSPIAPTVTADIYASFYDGILYLAAFVDNVSEDGATADGDYGYSGIEISLLLDKNRKDKYPWQLIANRQLNEQIVVLRTPAGNVFETDADGSLSSFHNGTITAAHTWDFASSPKTLTAEWAIDLQGMGDISGQLLPLKDMVIGVAVNIRGLPLYHTGAMWGCDDKYSGQSRWPWTTDTSAQGFTGGLRVDFVDGAESCNTLPKYLKDYADGNFDCDVDLNDFVYLANSWLSCTEPNEPGCVNVMN